MAKSEPEQNVDMIESPCFYCGKSAPEVTHRGLELYEAANAGCAPRLIRKTAAPTCRDCWHGLVMPILRVWCLGAE